MGRWYYSKKTESDHLLKISIFWLRRHGFLRLGGSGGISWTSGWTNDKNSISITSFVWGEDKHLRFRYTQTDLNGEKREFDYKIRLTTTVCNFGGERYWFVCPLSTNGRYCGRGVGVLYKAGDYFGCRHCYDLTYSSRNESRGGRYYPMLRFLGGVEKMEDLEGQIKRRFYAGKPTRKQRRLDRLYLRMVPYVGAMRKLGDLQQ